MSLHINRNLKYGIAGFLIAAGVAFMSLKPVSFRSYFKPDPDSRVERTVDLRNELETTQLSVRQSFSPELFPNYFVKEVEYRNLRKDPTVRDGVKMYDKRNGTFFNYLFPGGFLLFILGGACTNLGTKKESLEEKVD